VPDGPRILFVSKPIAPPWHDGSKNLVRDIACHLTSARPTVMTTPGAPSIGERVTQEAVYAEPGRFAPGLVANARVVRRLLAGDPHDAWHFVFAPNPASSTAARVARRARRAAGWRGFVVQTVASAPRSFEGVGRWMFGDVIVVLSEWMRGRLMGAGVKQPIRVIPPCAEAPRAPTNAARDDVRKRLEIGPGPMVLYPGDYEVSRGASTVARAVAAIVRAVPDAHVVFACRAKTPRSAVAARALQDDLRRAGVAERTRHVGEVDDMPALLANASAIAFPVDDLYGKVDLPLVLLEALALGVPMVLARGGPLEAIASARFVDPDDDVALAAEVVHLLKKPTAAADLRVAGKNLYTARFRPTVVAAEYDALYAEYAERAASGVRPSASS
jgi:phosphatidylinositol alpha-1,6-mannosyltransferase